MGATELWTATKASYPAQALIELTNRYAREGGTIVDAAGEDAAQSVINLWPIYAQAVYDDDNAQHVEVAKRGVIAVLQERGGSASDVAKIAFDDVFGPDGMVTQLRRTSVRGRVTPTFASADSNATADRSSWGDSSNMPRGILPSRRGADD